MTEIVAKWIQNRLGLVIDMTPDNFAVISANGYLLAQLLHSYQIIVAQQLDLIVDTDYVSKCYENFSHINVWLRDLNITIADEDLYETVHGVGTASLHLFYRVFLELKDKTQLDFLTDNELKFQLASKFTRFQVNKVQSNDNPNKVVLQFEDLCKPLLAGGSVYHWYKDRMDNLQNRCKDAREEYVHLLKTRCGSWSLSNIHCMQESGFVLPRSLTVSPRASFIETKPDELPTEIVSYDDRSYDYLVNKQNEAKKIEPIKPDEKEARKIMKHLKTKSKIRNESNILRNELNQEIMNEFDNKINMSKMMSQDRLITKIFMKQTIFEKELISKMGQVKLQKEFMVENKFKQAEVLNKLREKEFVDNLLLQDKELNEQKLSYYMERERVLQLHKKIWQARLRLRAKRIEDLCRNALKDIVNISIKVVEYKKRFHQEPTKREMDQIKKLFVSGQSAFENCDPMKIIKKQDDNEDDEEIDHIITQETFRQNALDHEEFQNYIHYDCPWELTNIVCTAETLEQIACGLNVLGHLVHQALLSKYPLPPIKEKPNFPEAEIRVCINGLNDVGCLPELRNLLSKKEIEVIELQNAVDFCLAAYHEENKREYDDEEIISIKEEKKKKKSEKPPKKGEKSQTKKKGKTFENKEVPPEEIQKTFENKIVQTPIIYPCEEIELSPQATLGKTAQDMLDLGLSLTDYLLVAIFVEYLKSIPNLKGWVLVNYPTTFEQAAILEEAFTGLSIVKNAKLQAEELQLTEIVELDEEERSDRCSIIQDLEMKRKSRLLPNPDIGLEPVKVYNTFLTAYIKIRKCDFDGDDGDSALPPIFEELGNEPDPLDKFYSDAGANYSMYYKEFDSAALKYLGKLIIGDYTLPLKTSVELFGDIINYMEFGTGTSKWAKGAKRGEQAKKPKEKIIKPPEESDKKATTPREEKKGKKATKVVIVHEDKYTQIPSEDEDEVETIFVEEDTVPITAGQKNWVYTRIPLSEELATTLATLWEAIEEIYINDLKQVFFLKRINMNAIMPYVQYIKDIMKKDRPDYKGYYLAKFQKAFNVFEIDFRKDDEFKREMYCRIEDFKEKLAELCDEKMMMMENERCKLIADNWTVRQVTELLNDYVNMFQIEMDRFTETFRFVNNYFMIVFTGSYCDEDPVKDEYFAKISDIPPEVINNFLQNVDSEKDLSFFENFLLGMIQKASNSIKKVSLAVSTCMDKIKSAQISSHSSKSKTSTPKGKASKDDKHHASHIEPDVIKENFEKLMEEWNCATKGESTRVLLRFDLLKHNALESLGEFLNTIQACFHGVYNDIRENYWKEMENIKKASRIFHLAVENEKQVQKELEFVDDTFSVNPEVNLFDNDPIIPKKSKEADTEGAFTIEQLSKIADILMDLSPTGFMLRASFIFFLQDLIWNNPEDGSNPMAPPLWRKLDHNGIRKVVDELFDDLEYVYWRDFIIYNLRIVFPKERELLLTRKQLRECDPDKSELIKDYQFYGTKLWFEYLFKQEDANKLILLKRLLSKLYYIKNYGINYTAMLLDFCKDTNLIEGFAKALELSLGKLVCWNQGMGNTFTQDLLQKIHEHDENVHERDLERDEYYKAAYEEVCKLVDYVVHIMEDVIIEDVDEEPKKDKNKDTMDYKEQTNVASSTKRYSKDASVQSGNNEKDTIDEIASQNEDILINKLYKELPDSVGTDAVENLQVEYFLPVDVVVTVITAALPWHSRVQKHEDLSFWERAVQIYEKARNPSFNNSVLSHEFLNSSDFLRLLKLTKKFLDMDPVRIVQSIVDTI